MEWMPWPPGEEEKRLALLSVVQRAAEAGKCALLRFVQVRNKGEPWRLAFGRIDLALPDDLPTPVQSDVALARTLVERVDGAGFLARFSGAFRGEDFPCCDERLDHRPFVALAATGPFRRYSGEGGYGCGWPSCAFMTDLASWHPQPNGKLLGAPGTTPWENIDDFVFSVSGFAPLCGANGGTDARLRGLTLIDNNYRGRITNASWAPGSKSVTVDLEGELTDQVVYAATGAPGGWRDGPSTAAAPRVILDVPSEASGIRIQLGADADVTDQRVLEAPVACVSVLSTPISGHVTTGSGGMQATKTARMELLSQLIDEIRVVDYGDKVKCARLRDEIGAMIGRFFPSHAERWSEISFEPARVRDVADPDEWVKLSYQARSDGFAKADDFLATLYTATKAEPPSPTVPVAKFFRPILLRMISDSHDAGPTANVVTSPGHFLQDGISRKDASLALANLKRQGLLTTAGMDSYVLDDRGKDLRDDPDEFEREFPSEDVRSHATGTPKAFDVDVTGPELATPDLSWMRDAILRRIASADFEEMSACLQCGAHKSALLLAGSACESMLLDMLERNVIIAKTYLRKAEDFPDRASLEQLVGAATDQGLVTATALHLAPAMKNYRDLIHPHRVRIGNIKVDVHTAKLLAQAAVIIGRDLRDAASDGRADAFEKKR